MKTRKLVPLFALLAGGVAPAAFAADNVVPTDGLWRGSGGLAASYTSGNSNASGVALNTDVGRATLYDKITLNGTVNYARSKADGISSTTSNKWSSFGRYDYNLSPHLFAFGRLGLAGDRVAHLTLRTAVDTGLGYKLVDTPDHSFSVFGGLGYSTDRYDSPQTISDRSGDRFSRSSVALAEESLHKLTPTVELKQRLDVNPGISGDKANLAKLTVGLAVAMTSSLSLNVSLLDNYNSQPPAGFVRNDVGVFTGINVKFGAR